MPISGVQSFVQAANAVAQRQAAAQAPSAVAHVADKVTISPEARIALDVKASFDFGGAVPKDAAQRLKEAAPSYGPSLQDRIAQFTGANAAKPSPLQELVQKVSTGANPSALEALLRALNGK